MTILTEVKERTDKIFEKGLSVVPNSDFFTDYQRKVEAYKEACLEFQTEDVLFELRCKQAEELGFESYSHRELVKMLTGEYPDSGFKEGRERQVHEYFYQHYDDKELKGSDCTWGSRPIKYSKTERKFLKKNTKWTIQVGKLNYLRKTIPYGVVLKINELKKLKLFNSFEVLAPIELWEKDIPDIDPIVCAQISSIIRRPNGRMGSDKNKNYFIAQW